MFDLYIYAILDSITRNYAFLNFAKNSTKYTFAHLAIVTRNQVRNISGPPLCKHVQKI